MKKSFIPICGVFVICFSFVGMATQTADSEISTLVLSGESGVVSLLSESGPIQFVCDKSQVGLIDEAGNFLGRLCSNGRIQFEKAKNISIQLFDEENQKVGFITRTGRIILNKECGKVDLIGAEDCKLCTFEGNFFSIHPEGEVLFEEH